MDGLSTTQTWPQVEEQKPSEVPGGAKEPQAPLPISWIAKLGVTIDAGLREIWAHKFRSFLTMLGIILGVSSLVGMAALVKGMERGAKEALIAIGGLEKVRVEPQPLPIDQRHLSDQAKGLTLSDAIALQRNATLIDEVSPMIYLRATVMANGKRFRPFLCMGVWPVAVDLNDHVVQYGRMFNEIDNELARNVCVIGTATRDALWGSPEETGEEIIPIGETIYINGVPFVIVGMFQHYESERARQERLAAEREAKRSGGPRRGTSPRRPRRGRDHFIFWLKNATIYMPLNTMWLRFQGSFGLQTSGGVDTGEPKLTVLEFKVRSFEELPEALQQARNVLLSTHKGLEDFFFRTQEQWADNIRQFIRDAQISGGLIAGISLIVGGVGIMNIMLASITERVREIGIRKSIGASNGDIFVQILVESVVISILGGLLGLGFSFVLVHFLSRVAPEGNVPIITGWAMAVAFAFSVLVGILAGITPAIKAARLDPIQALRYE